MKNILIVVLALLGFNGFAQVQDPTTWSTSVEKLNDSEYKLITTVNIGPGWHVYSQAKLEKDEGPIPTEFNFFKADGNYELIGTNEEFVPYAEYSGVWGFDVYQFANSARFEQVVKVLDKDLKNIFVEAYFMVCDDKQCLPPAPEALVFKLDNNGPAVDAKATLDSFYDAGEVPQMASGPEGSTIKKKSEVNSKKEPEVEVDKTTDDAENSDSLWVVFGLSFLGGLAALLTPCMFPMIPLTVSFFTKQSKNRAQGIRNAILYGVFIIAIYVLLGSAIVAIFGIEALNELSTSVTFNIAFFVILIIFAISFLGAFEITLPQSWANSADKQSNRGGVLGIFFMALALAIVSFSCTGPIVGSILFKSSSEGGIAPIIGMLGFSSAIALPFALFAIFPGWMNSLPKSGGWLNTVKVVLGFLELAFAFKFLSNADLVMDWGIITREVFLTIWIVVFGTMGLYLFGKIKLPHDGPGEHISVGRLLLGIFSLCIAVYLIPGLWGAPLKIISGFPPPLKYSESPYGVGNTKTPMASVDGETFVLPDGAHLGEYDIVTFDDYEKGLAYAQEVGKPMLIDFTGKACVNCRRMEQLVWGEPQILSKLKNDFVMVSLYVDLRKELPKDEWYKSEVTGNMIRTVGNKWGELQIKNYQINAQPYYAIIGADGKDISKPVGYTPDVAAFEKWLSKGIDAY
jgi:thiol:disulfide interchange protein DsbD